MRHPSHDPVPQASAIDRQLGLPCATGPTLQARALQHQVAHSVVQADRTAASRNPRTRDCQPRQLLCAAIGARMWIMLRGQILVTLVSIIIKNRMFATIPLDFYQPATEFACAWWPIRNERL